MGVSVDGNDLLAMYKVSKYAVERVRSGGGAFPVGGRYIQDRASHHLG